MQILDLTNNYYGGTIALTWNPTWQLANGPLPGFLPTGTAIRVVLICTGTTESSIVASCFTNAPSVFDVQAYGAAIGGSASSNLTAINNAISAMNNAGGGKLLFPGYGTYAVNGAITAITVPCEICGMSWGVTVLSQLGAYDGFTINTTAPCYIHDLLIQGPSNSENTGIIFGNSTTPNSSSTVERMEITQFLIGIAAANTINNFIINNCTIGCTHCIVVGGHNNSGSVVATTVSQTAGTFIVGGFYVITSVGTTDFTLIGAASNTNGISFYCSGVGSGTGTATLYSPSAAMIQNCTTSGITNGIWCLTPNGVLIYGNEMVSTVTAIRCTFQNLIEQSDIWIIGNHIECSGTGLLLDCNTNGVTNANKFSNFTIVGNEFGCGGYGIQTNSTTQWCLASVVVTGNLFTNVPSGCAYLEGIYGGTVTGNYMTTNGSVDNLYIDSSCRWVNGAQTNSYAGGNSGFVDNQTEGHTVATLQPPAYQQGVRTFITNGVSSPTWGAVVSTTGSSVQPVFSDGSNWRYG